MPSASKLLAWIEPRGGQEFEAAFVAAASRRAPATHRCASREEARRWVEREGDALGGVSIEWLEASQRRVLEPV
jgi:hypothetical protein